MKIFISIASYQDPLLEATLRSAYDKSDMPKNLVFGVCDQSSKSLNLNSLNENPLKENYKILRMEGNFF